MTTAQKIPDFVNTGTACEILDVSHRFLTRLVRLKQIPHYALPGDEIRFDRSELLAWLRTKHRPTGDDQ